MKPITFITGNQKKADYLAKYLGYPIEHIRLDLDEIQSLDLRTIVEHKVKQAYTKIGKPVLVDDVSLEFAALGRLPGTFIRFFLEEMDYADICSLVDGKDRSATARCGYGYYDGQRFEYFEGYMYGRISQSPSGDSGFGWDRFFIPDGYSITRAEMNEADDIATYTQIKPFAKVRDFLLSL